MASTAKQADHRPRVAAERRRRTRARLLDAVLRCCSGKGEFDLPSVEEVCQAADVSRATFYAHFDSVQAAVGSLGEFLLDEMADSLAAMFDAEGPLERITMGIQLFLMRSATDPEWAGFVSRVLQVSNDARFTREVRDDLEQASAAGEITIGNLDAAMSLALGSMFDAIRHLHKSGERRRDYVENLTIMVLRALGVPDDKAAPLMRAKSAQLRGLGPDHASWWRDPWI